MQLTHAIDKYRHTRHLIFTFRDELSLIYKLLLTLSFACVTGLAAQVRIPLPFTPVPVTGQVLVVLMSGIALGSYYGALSQVFYIGIGAMGLPWFNGWTGGLAVVTGVTGGYLFGFVLAALMIGWLTDKYISARRFYFQLLLMAVGVAIIYVLGAIQFALVMNTGFMRTLQLAALPFIPFDFMKAALAAGISASILPKSGKLKY